MANPGLDPTPVFAQFTDDDTDADIAAALAVSLGAVRKWRRGIRRIRPSTADDIANRLGLHLYDLWPHLLEADIAAAEKVCAASECSTRFVPYRSTSLYCSPSCSRRAGRERRTAEQRQRDAQKVAAWKAANADHCRAYNREYQRPYMRAVRRRAARSAA